MASGIMGSTAGWPAAAALLSHFSVMVRGSLQLFVGGPPVVKAGLGIDINEALAAKHPCSNEVIGWTQKRLPDGSPARP